MKKILFMLAMLAFIPFCNADDTKEVVIPSTEDVCQNVYYTKENYVFAATEELLDKAVKLVAQGDKAAFNEMMQAQQIFLWKKNLEVYIMKSKLTKVKVRPKGKTIEVWTVQEAISSKPSY
ncbi:hypothetical protein [uncultured Bacteroides sp.]|uniref:hypothetical protein n=1 Tax=uncultured Bacteroides sp. TaxID=162156 RepID=UPI0025F0B865|nr:hypothetical protein [uncultured Bacteroides sp.]